ncbi:hypothetical protein SAMD00023353_5000550 [Rosellinia necatrix]|uniref:Uncharacterized protein n=1 Tax=Rosellinia necatrix TaxID=77044 RepID=A0A1W2TQ64_ROSNE|nr:hypothetical protein SAMD00023353_5000550 [Rosellinia necatrix]
MLSIKTLTATAVAGLLLPLAAASPMISALVTPATAVAGENITATLRTSIYIQNWEDFGIVWGLTSPKVGGQGPNGEIYVGPQIAYTALYGNDVNKLNNFTVELAIPENQPAGDWLLVAAVPYLVGASGFTAVRSFNSTINITN